ncbi:MAG TPA: flavin reductase family protein [Bacillales bacterium]|nr:flavin reductase family protein [Bacillales bacterium]
MIIDPKEQSTRENYKLMIGSVVPRPIAFVTSENAEGVVNAAPFSFFNVLTASPPLIYVSVGRHPDGRRKDTAANILDKKEFVVHVVDEDNIEKVNFTSMDFPPEYSEVKEAGLTLYKSHVVGVPGVAEAKIRMECVLHQAIPLGDAAKPSNDLLIGEVVCFDIADEVYEAGKIDADTLKPVGRLAGTDFTKIGEVFSIPRPKFKDWKGKD